MARLTLSVRDRVVVTVVNQLARRVHVAVRTRATTADLGWLLLGGTVEVVLDAVDLRAGAWLEARLPGGALAAIVGAEELATGTVVLAAAGDDPDAA